MPNPYQVMPALSIEEYEALKADIAKRGVLIPIEVDEETGEILDGFHRLRACQELGIEAPVVARQLGSEQERIEHALVLNLLRRHMGAITWAEAFKKLARARGLADRLVSSAGRPQNNADTVSALSQEIGVNPRTARRRLKLAADLAPHPDLAEKVDRHEMEARRALRIKREREARERSESTPPPVLPSTVDLRRGDFRQVLADLPEGSVDLVFTDPPYAKEFLPLWSSLAELARRILKPGCPLITYTGQYHLLEVMNRLAEHLEYVWIGSILTHGPKSINHPRKVYAKHKPLLVFSKGKYVPLNFVHDFIDDDRHEKDAHEWQQGITPALYYIEHLTPMGGVVVDPFLGSGTTGMATVRLNRSFIGAEEDATTYWDARTRIANAS